MTSAGPPEDLSARSRRGELSDAEERRLEIYLQGSPSARDLHEVGLAFDRFETSLPDDELLLERVLDKVSNDAAVERLSKQQRRGHPWFKLSPISLVILLLSSVAAASVLGLHQGRALDWGSIWPRLTGGQVRQSATRAPEHGSRARRAPRGRATSAVPSSPAPASDIASGSAASAPDSAPAGSAAPQPVARAGAPERPHRDSAPPAPRSASALFALANSVRKGGADGEALRLYRQLQRIHPDSPEAQLSYVITGRMLLANGNADAAAAAFDRYLAVAANAGLAAEALQGKAQALQRLGRRSEERRVWQRLLERFPDSVYGELARERLAGEP